ncbi:hypothetical protein [Thiomicrorhabdus indica]|uniref:hypothetical protein n=1 Tax=Thiomicrorhabdus indica TaxID=2267253 RepID=UPI00102DC59A|nr:hypothetical protein [Thiomicrorhabdus indica]
MTNEELDIFLRTFYEIKEQSVSGSYGFDDNWNIFIKKILALSPKSYGTKIQNRVIFQNDLKHVKANEDKGDFRKNSKYYEIKTSILTVTNKAANITGVRPWQPIDGYYILIIDARDFENICTYNFHLTKEQMSEELKCLKALPLNGTKRANEGNINLPQRFQLSLNDGNFKRWVQRYSFDTDEVIKKL